GMNEWKSVQDVIRGTFKTLHDVIKAQGVAIKSLERQLEGKVAHVELQGMLDRKANMSDVNKSVAEILHMLDAKASIRDMEQKANKAEVALGIYGNQDALSKAIAKKADCNKLEEMERAMNKSQAQMSDRGEGEREGSVLLLTSQQMNSALSRDVLKQIQQHTSDVNNQIVSVKNELGRSHKKMREELDELRLERSDRSLSFGKVYAEMAEKANVADMSILLDGKVDVDAFNRAMIEVNSLIQEKASLQDVSSSWQDKYLMLSQPGGEVCSGRWIWKSLKTKASGVVPWNLQSSNSDPVHLVWEKDKTYILCVLPGLYCIELGFFSRKRPSARVHVNGEPAITIGSSPAHVTYHAGSRLLSSGRYTNSNLTGLTHVDFLVLPSKSRVSLSYQGDEDAEGFLTLKKL
ncbi:hypothetical protein GUITHDRAFT_80649, partial [Guillardia theta CCMP2712]